MPRQTREVEPRECERCGEAFFPWKGKPTRFCSMSCASRSHQGTPDPHKNQRKMALRRARKREVECEVIDPLRVFTRDNWRCHMCKCRVTKDAPYPSPNYATLDHLVPISRGGPHTYANIATACFACNIRKGTRAVGEQLALIG